MRLGGGVSDMDIYSYAGVGTCPFLGILNITFKYLLEIFGDYIPNSSVMLNWDINLPVHEIVATCFDPSRDVQECGCSFDPCGRGVGDFAWCGTEALEDGTNRENLRR